MYYSSVLESGTLLRLVYDIIYSFYKLYDRVFLPFIIHEYVYKLVEQGIVPDYWKDWIRTGLGPYSPRLANIINILKNYGLLVETCTKNGKICGLYTLPENPPKPERVYVTML
ncbi:MAG: hypothetical protein ABWW65_07800 [Thermoprotei archaeon]